MTIRNPASKLFERVKKMENADFLISSLVRGGGVFRHRQPDVSGSSSQLTKENNQ